MFRPSVADRHDLPQEPQGDDLRSSRRSDRCPGQRRPFDRCLAVARCHREVVCCGKPRSSGCRCIEQDVTVPDLPLTDVLDPAGWPMCETLIAEVISDVTAAAHCELFGVPVQLVWFDVDH